MKKTLLICAALLAVSVSSAFAGGVNLSWDDCGTNGSQNKFGTPSFSCNTNASTAVRVSSIVGTYAINASITDLAANEVVLDMKTAGGTLAPWWNFSNFPSGNNGCRAGQLAVAFRSVATSCNDWPGSAGVAGNMTVEAGFGGIDKARIKTIQAYTGGSPQPLIAGDETISFVLTVNNGLTVGTGSCAGCNVAMCMVLNSIIVNQAPAQAVPIKLSNPLNANFVTWNDALNTTGCPGSTPTRNSSWGQVKSLYRD